MGKVQSCGTWEIFIRYKAFSPLEACHLVEILKYIYQISN